MWACWVNGPCWAGWCTRGSDEGDARGAPPRFLPPRHCRRASTGPLNQDFHDIRAANRGRGPEGPPSSQAVAGRRYAERVPGLLSPSSDAGRSDRLSTSARISLSGYRRWPPRVRTKGSLPSLAQRDTVFGDTWSRAAACEAVRCLVSLGLGWRI